MFNNDVSYLYSDEYLTSPTSNEKELPVKKTKASGDQPTSAPIDEKVAPASSLGHRSKHILLFRGDVLQHDKRRGRNRMIARRLREKRQLFEENPLRRMKQLIDEQYHSEDDLKQHHVQTDTNNIFCTDIFAHLLLTGTNESSPLVEHYSDNSELLPMSTTQLLNMNNDTNDNLDT